MKKIIIIGSTNQKSIGRKFAEWIFDFNLKTEIFLISRSLEPLHDNLWHEIPCDVNNKEKIQKIIKDIVPDIVFLMPDSGSAGKRLEDLSAKDVTSFIDVKISASVFIAQAVLAVNKDCQLVWTMGSLENKFSDMILYSIVNNGILGFIKQLNFQSYKSYYLMTPLLETNLTKQYLKKNSNVKKFVQNIEVLKPQIELIINDLVRPGIVNLDSAI